MTSGVYGPIYGSSHHSAEEILTHPVLNGNG